MIHAQLTMRSNALEMVKLSSPAGLRNFYFLMAGNLELSTRTSCSSVFEFPTESLKFRLDFRLARMGKPLNLKILKTGRKTGYDRRT